MTLARLREILRRQDPPKWGPAYEPSIKATREEAPGMSWAAQQWSQKLGRYAHTLSRAEAPPLRVALLNPNLVDLHEERMIPMQPCPHPLHGHPLAAGLHLPDLEGSIAVAARLDKVSYHNWLRIKGQNLEPDTFLPTPFIGDFLLFLTDPAGIYCINWTIKQSEEDFSRSLSPRKRLKNPEKDAADAQARHAIEAQVYQDGGIRTVRVTSDMFPDQFDDNLRNLFLNHAAVDLLEPQVEKELEDRLRASMDTKEVPMDIAISMLHRHQVSFDALRQTTFRLLWERKVRAELFDDVILFDRPLRREKTDPIKHFSHLFTREAS